MFSLSDVETHEESDKLLKNLPFRYAVHSQS
jgi:hypothetical protein